jgi:hypothetical protein
MAALPTPVELSTSGTAAARLRIAAAASAVLCFGYLLAVPTELARLPLYAALFLAIALGQGRLAVALLGRPGSAALLAGIWGNLTVAGLYLLSRTVGLPFGPLRPLGRQPGGAHHAPVAGGVGNGVPFLPQPLGGTRIETVGALDLGVVAVQFAVVVVLVSLLPARACRWTTNTMCACGLAVWTLGWLGVLG